MLEEYFPDRGGTIKNTDIIRLTTGGMRDGMFATIADEKLAIIMEDGSLWNPSIIQ